MSSWFERQTGLWLVDAPLIWFGLAAALIFLARAWLSSRRAPAVPSAALALMLGDGAARPSLAVRLAPLTHVLQALGLVVLGVALARPVVRTKEPLEARGRDLVLVLDVSSSMAAHDLDADRTRLAVAQAAAADFVQARAGDRLALVSFARFPDVVVPPTLDHEALLSALAALELVATDGDEDVTGLGLALARAVELRSDEGDGARVVVLLSDGMENVADGTRGEIPPTQAARLARARDVRVHTVAVGAQRGGGAQLDTSELELVASHTGGSFARVGDAASLAEVYANIDRLEPATWSAPRVTTDERFHVFVVVGLALLALGRLLRDGPLEVLP